MGPKSLWEKKKFQLSIEGRDRRKFGAISLETDSEPLDYSNPQVKTAKVQSTW